MRMHTRAHAQDRAHTLPLMFVGGSRRSLVELTTTSSMDPKRKKDRKQCLHGRSKNACKECDDESTCLHERQKSLCKCCSSAVQDSLPQDFLMQPELGMNAELPFSPVTLQSIRARGSSRETSGIISRYMYQLQASCNILSILSIYSF